MILKRNQNRKRKAVAGILGALLLFVMLFTVGSGYFLFVNQANLEYTQALSNRGGAIQGTYSESLSLLTSLASNGHIAVSVTNSGPRASTVQGLMVVSPTGTVQYITSGASPALPLPLNAGATTAAIDTSIAYTSGIYMIKALTQQGSTFSATYPPTTTSLAAQALTSGAIGDLYLQFNSYAFYTVACNNNNINYNCNIVSSTCPYTGSDSGYCLDTNSGNTGPGFALQVSTYQNDFIAFSITLTDLSSSTYDIVLNQFTLIYQNMFGYYWHDYQGEVPWYIVSVGTKSNGMIPILNQYSPVVLQYDVPTTVYFVAQNCVSASTGPNHSTCENVNNNNNAPENICQVGYGGNCNQLGGTVSTVFIIAGGWELAHGSYTVANLQYSGTNYGQNAPFVSTLYY